MASIPIRRGLVGARLVVALTAVGVVATVTRPLPAQSDVAETKPVRALLITGGCCHDYDYQARKLVQGSQERALVEWTVELDPRNGTRGKIELYDDPDWAKPYDVVVHNECFADTRDPEYVRKITEVHKGGVPAVVIHCAMHTYRAADFDDWRELLGVTSMHHEHQSEYIVKNEAFDHPIMEGFPTEWITPRDELYIIRKVWPNTTALATAESERDSGAQPVIWTSKFGEARVFGTTFGHNSATFNDPVFLNFVTRGILWAADRLSDDYLQPMEVATEPADAEPAHPEPEPDVAEPADEDNLSTNDTTPEPSLLDEVKVPEGFTATIYATPPEVNYPVFVAAAPNGDLYVSVDKNGSLDREPNRGSVLRLRDTTGDGQADEIKTFIENVDSPRGLAWDHDRLYLMHPPHLSVFVDEDGDGTSDRQEIIVKNIAFGLNERPADHTSNGVTLGIDGWLYLAIGDFGFMNAAGTDGRTLQLRGGGVVRVMTDGTGLELYSRGTRNIVEVAVDPLLNAFARDNTNDGNGWDIRLHHFSGLENHGYPSQFQNFAEEIVQPLAEYGGGSGCGALYLDEPGYPDGFGTALYTADWGRQAVFRQPLQPSGATFTADQDVFAELTRVTDLDADALSRLYLASWKNATYTYNGEDIGFLVRVTPTGYEPTPLPDFANAAEAELVELLKSPSHRRRLEAQRELVRRGIDDDTAATIEQLAADENAELPHRVAALFALKQGLGQQSHAMIAKLAAAADLRPLAIRALADRHDQLADVPTDLILAGLTDANARTRLERCGAAHPVAGRRRPGRAAHGRASAHPAARGGCLFCGRGSSQSKRPHAGRRPAGVTQFSRSRSG
jgi:type 1 glutamine amidotransferase